MIVSIPGEMTAEMGRRVRDAVTDAARGSGVTERRHLRPRERVRRLLHDARRSTTPSTTRAGRRIYGRASWVALQEALVELTRRPGPGSPGAAALSVRPPKRGHGRRRPVPARRRERHRRPPAGPEAWRLGTRRFSWRGGVRGFDRPLERAFVQIQRRTASGGWQTVDSDLGLAVLWRVNEDGLYRARWEPRLGPAPRRLPLPDHRQPLHHHLEPVRAARHQGAPAAARRGAAGEGRGRPRLPAGKGPGGDRRPAPGRERSLTHRPRSAASGRVTFIVDGQPVTVGAGPGGRFEVRANPGDQIQIPAGAGLDGFGNRTGQNFGFQA